MIKKLGKQILTHILEGQVKKLRIKNNFKLIAVAGSIGKTSTKIAIARLLNEGYRVRFQDGNYNDRLTVPLIFFNRQEPPIFNLLAWIKLIYLNYQDVKRDYPFDYVIVELGTDGIGQMEHFSYLNPDLYVLTSISPEHMENFHTLDNVAAEELVMIKHSKQCLINIDDCSRKYLKGLKYISYGISENADYRLINLETLGIKGSKATLKLSAKQQIHLTIGLLGIQGAKICLAAISVVDLLAVIDDKILKQIANLPQISGRMQVLKGVNGSTIIDDTYNASPTAVCSALDVLYDTNANQRIAILGSMNELGDYGIEAHQLVGRYCDPLKLSLVVTIGGLARDYLASAAEANGCTVMTFLDPNKAGEYVRKQIKQDTVILVKGSQNGVFAEEAIKPLLKYSKDSAKLVRQSAYWLDQKNNYYKLIKGLNRI